MSCRQRVEPYLQEDSVITRIDEYDRLCLVDYKDKSIQDEIESVVNCEELCTVKGDYESEEYKDCADSCKDQVETSAIGSLVVDKDTLSIKESTIPISCSLVGMVEAPFELKTKAPAGYHPKTKQLEAHLDKIDCTEMDIGWIHPHEFLPEASEWEEDPAVCYLHIRAKALYEIGRFGSGCRLPDVARTLWGVKEKFIQQTLV